MNLEVKAELFLEAYMCHYHLSKIITDSMPEDLVAELNLIKNQFEGFYIRLVEWRHKVDPVHISKKSPKEEEALAAMKAAEARSVYERIKAQNNRANK